MGRARWAGVAGCQADQAADQARADNGSQDTVSRATARARTARRSPGWRGLVLWFQGSGGMADLFSGERAAANRRPQAQPAADQLVILTGSPSGVRRMKEPTAFAAT